MGIAELEEYFGNNEESYDSTYLIKVLEGILGKPFNEIREDINNKRVTVTQEQIESFLEQRLIMENPELKVRVESPKPKRSNNMSEWTQKDIEEKSKELADRILIKRYRFEPYTLEYFNRYIDIVKNKINTLLDIVSGLANNDLESIQGFIDELDIQIEENGQMSREEIIRLLKPILANIKMLDKKADEANNLSTYLTFKESKSALARDGISESELYPETALQIQNELADWREDYVKLSDKQKKTLELKQSKIRKAIWDFLSRIK